MSKPGHPSHTTTRVQQQCFQVFVKNKEITQSSYTEAVLRCQSSPNRFNGAVRALEAHKPELLEQTTHITMLDPNTICVLVKSEFTLQTLILV